MGDFSKDPEIMLQDALAKNYSRVRFQQGKPVLDRELNLLADLASPQRFAQNTFGNGILGEGSDFLISNLSVPTNDFRITAGTCLVNGYEVVLVANTTYKTQPRAENVAPLPGGISNVYLRVFRSETNGIQDVGLLNASDVGSETAIREKVEWEVLVSTLAINTRDHLLLAIINVAGPTVTDRRRKGLNVGAIRDELTNARGSTAQLSARLDASLTTTGTLRSTVVGNSQIADNAVGPTKLADGAVTSQKIANNAIGSPQLADNAVISTKIVNNGVITTKLADANVTTQKLAPGAVTEPILANNAVSNRTIANAAVSLAKLSAPQVVNQQVTIPAAPAGQRAEVVVNLQEADTQAFFLVSVHFDAPRPGGLIGVTRSIDWKYRVTLVKPPLLGAVRHFHQVVIDHANNVAVTVTVQALRLT